MNKIQKRVRKIWQKENKSVPLQPQMTRRPRAPIAAPTPTIAAIAQLVEHFIRNEKVVGSSPTRGSDTKGAIMHHGIVASVFFVDICMFPRCVKVKNM